MAAVECPECKASFDLATQGGMGGKIDGPLSLEWDRLYDSRLRVWISGNEFPPAQAFPGAPAHLKMRRSPFRECVHECEPAWPDRDDGHDRDPVPGSPDAPPSRQMLTTIHPAE
jgi:hypothetical protein